MKVYELISKLQKAPAGAEVVVGMTATLNASLEDVGIELRDEEYGQIILTGGDAQVISDDGDELGYLSELSAGTK